MSETRNVAFLVRCKDPSRPNSKCPFCYRDLAEGFTEFDPRNDLTTRLLKQVLNDRQWVMIQSRASVPMFTAVCDS